MRKCGYKGGKKVTQVSAQFTYANERISKKVLRKEFSKRLGGETRLLEIWWRMTNFLWQRW